MKTPIFHILLSVAVFMVIFTVGAQAGFETVVVPATIDEGTSITAVRVPLAKANIKEAYLWVPTLDADDVSTVSMKLVFNDSSGNEKLIAPNGWTDIGIGATDDNAMVKGFAQSTNIYCDRTAVFEFKTSTNQEADRNYLLYLILEY